MVAKAAGGTQARLVEQHLGLAQRLAAGLSRGRRVLHEDLQQSAYLGLVLAAQRYDPGRGAPFAAFAIPTIRGAVLRHLRDHSATLTIPRRDRVDARRMRAAEYELSQRLGEWPGPAAVAVQAGLSDAEAFTARLALAASTTQEFSRSPTAGLREPDPVGDGVSRGDEAWRLLAVLSPRERRMVVRRVMLGWTLTDVAASEQLSPRHASRILAAAIGSLRSRAQVPAPVGP